MVKNEGFYLLDATVLSATTIEEDDLSWFRFSTFSSYWSYK